MTLHQDRQRPDHGRGFQVLPRRSIRRAAAGMLLAVALSASPVGAEPPEPSPIMRVYAQRCFQLDIVAGRIVVLGMRLGGFSTRSTDHRGRQERLSIQSLNAGGGCGLSYGLTTPEQNLSIDLDTESRLRISRLPQGDSKDPAVEFEQSGGSPITLKIGAGPKWEAPMIWHLFLAHPEECQTHLAPYLTWLKPEGNWATAARGIEAEMLRQARDEPPPDRRHWEDLVAQLGAEQYAKREAADRELRGLGHRVAFYLRNLDLGTLDAEQRFRVRRIVQALSNRAAEESARDVASILIEDPAVWLILLERPSIATRKTALAQLERLLGRSIGFDPAAAPPVRATLVESLRHELTPAKR